MKLVTYEIPTPLGRFERLGALSAAGIVDLNFAELMRLGEAGVTAAERRALASVPPDMLGLLDGGPESLDAAREALAYAEKRAFGPGEAVGPRSQVVVHIADAVRLLAPLPRPRSLRDFLTFEQHAGRSWRERGESLPRQWYEMPIYYKGSHHAILGPDDDLPWPAYTEKLDYELELGCVLGGTGRNLSPDDAERLIAGYTVLNDFSARDIQFEEMVCRLGPAKGKDFGTALGPCLVTADEVDARNLRMIARVNGEAWSDGNSGTSHWTFPQMIAHVSREETVYPGEVLGSGTVGLGCGLELGKFLSPGDVVELEIEGIGVLRNRVVKL